VISQYEILRAKVKPGEISMVSNNVEHLLRKCQKALAEQVLYIIEPDQNRNYIQASLASNCLSVPKSSAVIVLWISLSI